MCIDAGVVAGLGGAVRSSTLSGHVVAPRRRAAPQAPDDGSHALEAPRLGLGKGAFFRALMVVMLGLAGALVVRGCPGQSSLSTEIPGPARPTTDGRARSADFRRSDGTGRHQRTD